ncbi:MAG: EthD family reductase, partial [Saprospiraceae bacterium]|nr:EthD family reductase [Saprospiraceae bacterium]
ILYPNDEGKTFNMDYYSSKHMPMLVEIFGDKLKKIEIDKCVSGRTPKDPCPYLTIGHLYFESLSDYRDSFSAHADTIRGDIPNYTNVRPMIQISEVIQ